MYAGCWYRPETFFDVIGDDDGAKLIVYNQFAMELHLIRKAATYPVGFHFELFPVDSDIERFDLPLTVKRSDNWYHL